MDSMNPVIQKRAGETGLGMEREMIRRALHELEDRGTFRFSKREISAPGQKALERRRMLALLRTLDRRLEKLIDARMEERHENHG